MKNSIILFIIGVLVGAVISTGVFYVYTTTNNNNNCSNTNTQMNGGSPPEMPSGQGSQPPEMPNSNTQSNS